ncbi:MAG: hypothetical protein ACFB6R_12250 [Alphaproteobacteria bacterium]
MVPELHRDRDRTGDTHPGSDHAPPNASASDGYEARLPQGRSGLVLALVVALVLGILLGPILFGVFGGVFGMIMGILGGIYGLAVGILALVLTGFVLILPAFLLIAIGYGLAVMFRARRNGA